MPESLASIIPDWDEDNYYDFAQHFFGDQPYHFFAQYMDDAGYGFKGDTLNYLLTDWRNDVEHLKNCVDFEEALRHHRLWLIEKLLRENKITLEQLGW